MSAFAQNIAVVIGIDSYINVSQLQTASNDAKAVYQVLTEQHRYQPVHLLLNEEATLAGIRETLATLPTLVPKHSRFLFYFAGHGIAINSEATPAGYLVPQNATPDNVDSMLAMHELYTALASLPCRHLFVILDCCFAGAFRWSNMRLVTYKPPVLYQQRFERYTRSAAWQVLTSAAHDQKAKDLIAEKYLTGRRESDIQNGSARHSPFAYALLKALRDGEGDLPTPHGDGVITATELYYYLRQQVELPEANYDQTPNLWPLPQHDRGEYIFEFPKRFTKLPSAPELFAATNPYLGLQPYTESDQFIFFGRDRHIANLLGLLENHSLIHVVGLSGSGKSSLVMAGLLPTLRERQWQGLQSIRPGNNPLESLLRWLPIAQSSSATDCEQIISWHDTSTPIGLKLRHQFDQYLQKQAGQPVLLVVDQLEELLTLCTDRSLAVEFIQVLDQLLQAHPDQFHLITTLRSDFEPQFQKIVSDAQSLHFAQRQVRFLVPPMTQDELRAVIEEPAAARVLFFKPSGLVDTLINEVVQMPGALPLLSFTLSELYLNYLESGREDRTLTEEEYQKLGGVLGSLRHRADEIEDELRKEGAANALKHIMVRMISIEGGEWARRRVSDRELQYPEPQQRMIELVRERLIANRLIITDQDTEEHPFFEPAHDELVRVWPQLTTWIQGLNEDAETHSPSPKNSALRSEEENNQITLQYQRRLWQAAQYWHEQGAKPPQETLFARIRRTLREIIGEYIPLEPPRYSGLLWDDPAQSATLEALLKQHQAGISSWMNKLERDFAQQSTARAKKNRQLRRRILQSLTVLFVAATTAAILALITLGVANTRLAGKLQEESQRLANSMVEQLTIDPVAALNLGYQALPRAGAERPYIADAEGGVTRALRLSLERQYQALSTEPLTPQRVTFGKAWIAVGGSQLHLVNQAINATVVLSASPANTLDVQWVDDSRLLTTGGNELQLWQDQQVIARDKFDHEIACAVVDPGAHQVAVCDENTLWLWALADHSRKLFVGLPDAILGARWSPDGTRIAVWDQGKTIRVLGSADGLPIATPALEMEAGVYESAWSNDSHYLAVIRKNQTAQIYRPSSVTSPLVITTTRGTGNVRWIQDDQFLFWNSGSRAELWSAAAGALVADYGQDQVGVVETVIFTEHTAFALLMEDNSVALVENSTPTQPIYLRGQRARVRSAAYNGHYLATGSIDGSVWIWDVAQCKAVSNCEALMKLAGHTIQRTEERADVLGVHWWGKQHLLTHGLDGTLRLWQLFDDFGDPLCDGANQGIPRCFDPNSRYKGHRGEITSIRWLDNETFVTTSQDGSAGRWQLATSTAEFVHQTMDSKIGSRFVWSPQANAVLEFNPTEKIYHGLIQPLDPREKAVIIPGPIANAFWIEAGIITVDFSGTVRLIDPQNGKIGRELEQTEELITAVAEHANGAIAIGDSRGHIQIWADDPTQPPIIFNRDLAVDEQYLINAFEWSRDGQRLLSIGRRVTLWDVAAKRPLWGPVDFETTTVNATFSPDELMVAFAASYSFGILSSSDGHPIWTNERSHDQTVKGIQWVESRPWKHQEITVFSAAYWQQRLFPTTAPRYLLLTWSGDNTVRLWDWLAETEIDQMTDLAPISAAAINPRGDHIVTATTIYSSGPTQKPGIAGILRIWHLWHQDHEELLQATQAAITRRLSSQQSRALIGSREEAVSSPEH